MVRTRAKKTTTAQQKQNANSVQEFSEESWRVWLLDFEKELADRMSKLKSCLEVELSAMDVNLLKIFSKMSKDVLNLPASSLCNENSSILSLDSTISSTIIKQGFATSTAFKPMPPPEPKTTRQSRARTKRTRTSSLSDVSAVYPDLSTTRRLTRSSSQPRDGMSKIITEYQTPLNRPNRTMTAVTPKVDPYHPMPLKRFARQGEMAISLTGSPLMMTTSVKEPNICLPLNNGQEVYSILPTAGPCPAIPSMDATTRQKLVILRENLNKILGE